MKKLSKDDIECLVRFVGLHTMRMTDDELRAIFSKWRLKPKGGLID